MIRLAPQAPVVCGSRPRSTEPLLTRIEYAGHQVLGCRVVPFVVQVYRDSELWDTFRFNQDPAGLRLESSTAADGLELVVWFGPFDLLRLPVEFPASCPSLQRQQPPAAERGGGAALLRQNRRLVPQVISRPPRAAGASNRLRLLLSLSARELSGPLRRFLIPSRGDAAQDETRATELSLWSSPDSPAELWAALPASVHPRAPQPRLLLRLDSPVVIAFGLRSSLATEVDCLALLDECGLVTCIGASFGPESRAPTARPLLCRFRLPGFSAPCASSGGGAPRIHRACFVAPQSLLIAALADGQLWTFRLPDAGADGESINPASPEERFRSRWSGQPEKDSAQQLLSLTRGVGRHEPRIIACVASGEGFVILLNNGQLRTIFLLGPEESSEVSSSVSSPPLPEAALRSWTQQQLRLKALLREAHRLAALESDSSAPQQLWSDWVRHLQTLFRLESMCRPPSKCLPLRTGAWLLDTGVALRVVLAADSLPDVAAAAQGTEWMESLGRFQTLSSALEACVEIPATCRLQLQVDLESCSASPSRRSTSQTLELPARLLLRPVRELLRRLRLRNAQELTSSPVLLELDVPLDPMGASMVAELELDSVQVRLSVVIEPPLPPRLSLSGLHSVGVLSADIPLARRRFSLLQLVSESFGFDDGRASADPKAVRQAALGDCSARPGSLAWVRGVLESAPELRGARAQSTFGGALAAIQRRLLANPLRRQADSQRVPDGSTPAATVICGLPLLFWPWSFASSLGAVDDAAERRSRGGLRDSLALLLRWIYGSAFQAKRMRRLPGRQGGGRLTAAVTLGRELGSVAASVLPLGEVARQLRSQSPQGCSTGYPPLLVFRLESKQPRLRGLLRAHLLQSLHRLMYVRAVDHWVVDSGRPPIAVRLSRVLTSKLWPSAGGSGSSSLATATSTAADMQAVQRMVASEVMTEFLVAVAQGFLPEAAVRAKAHLHQVEAMLRELNQSPLPGTSAGWLHRSQGALGFWGERRFGDTLTDEVLVPV